MFVDSNVIFASLIKGESSKTLSRIIMLEEAIEIVLPEEGLAELHEHSKKLKELSKDFENALVLLFTRIHVIPKEFYEDKIQEAYEIAKNFDPEDTPFIALALKLNIPVWTNDRQMIVHGLKSGRYLAIDTKAVEELLEGKSLEDVKKGLEKRFLP